MVTSPFAPSLHRYPHPPFLDELGRVSTYYGPGLDIAKDTGSGPDNGALSHCHAGTDEGIRTNPYLVLDRHGGKRLRHMRLLVVVTGGAKMGMLGNRAVGTDTHASPTVAYNVRAHAAVIVHDQLPGFRNTTRGMRIGLPADARPKEPQEKAPPRVRRLGTASK